MYAEPDLRGLDAEGRVAHRRRRSLEMQAMQQKMGDSRLPMRRASGDPLENLRRIASIQGAKGNWTIIADAPKDEMALDTIWEASENGHTIVHVTIKASGQSHFAGFVFNEQNSLTARFHEFPSDVELRSLDEIEALKAEWLKDPDWELEFQDGFGAHQKELRAFRLETELQWGKEQAAKDESQLVSKMQELDTDNRMLAGYVLRLEATIKALEGRIATLESC